MISIRHADLLRRHKQEAEKKTIVFVLKNKPTRRNVYPFIVDPLKSTAPLTDREFEGIHHIFVDFNKNEMMWGPSMVSSIRDRGWEPIDAKLANEDHEYVVTVRPRTPADEANKF